MLIDRLRERIETEGPMPFEDFMAACLYDPGDGFFATGVLRSTKEGDFLTSPEVSPWFGTILAGFAAKERARVGGDRPFLVVDAGAGSGSLLRPLLASLASPAPPGGASAVPAGGGASGSSTPPALRGRREEGGARRAEGAPSAYEYHAVEASPAARAALIDLLGADRVHESLDDLPDRFRGIVIANELLDNLPAALALKTADGWRERRVGATAGRLRLVTVPARPGVTSWCEEYAGAVPDGGQVEVQLVAGEWVRRLLGRIEAGALVAIDYGGTAEELEPRRTRGTLRTYRSHHLGPDPLLEPGATDVTVDVNFTAMAAVAEAADASVQLLRQDDFLAGLGLRDALSDLRHRELALARGDDAMERLVVRSEITDAETLLHPRGLGDFRVLVARKD